MVKRGARRSCRGDRRDAREAGLLRCRARGAADGFGGVAFWQARCCAARGRHPCGHRTPPRR
eukprot:8951188-Alexandrium_andersonii.AAC.1